MEKSEYYDKFLKVTEACKEQIFVEYPKEQANRICCHITITLQVLLNLYPVNIKDDKNFPIALHKVADMIQLCQDVAEK
jgi:hypothetical protein